MMSGILARIWQQSLIARSGKGVWAIAARTPLLEGDTQPQRAE
jgi:hypothetical protein